jgi:ribosome-associated toxin RatA of RatAB toxin-antitoxin module
MSNNKIVKEVYAKKVLDYSKKEIFRIIAEHEKTGDWLNNVKQVVLLKEGSPSNGVGAIREVTFKPKLWSTIEEEIFLYDQDNTYSYRIIKGMPGLLKHKGTWTLNSIENGKTEVIWTVYFEFKKYHWFSLFLKNFITTFNKVQVDALEDLDAFLGQKNLG